MNTSYDLRRRTSNDDENEYVVNFNRRRPLKDRSPPPPSTPPPSTAMKISKRKSLSAQRRQSTMKRLMDMKRQLHATTLSPEPVSSTSSADGDVGRGGESERTFSSPTENLVFVDKPKRTPSSPSSSTEHLLIKELKEANSALIEWKIKYQRAREYRDAKDIIESDLRQALNTLERRSVADEKRREEERLNHEIELRQIRETFAREKRRMEQEYRERIENRSDLASRRVDDMKRREREFSARLESHRSEVGRLTNQLEAEQDKSTCLSNQLTSVRSMLNQRTRLVDKLVSEQKRRELVDAKSPASKWSRQREINRNLSNENERLRNKVARLQEKLREFLEES